MIFKNEKNKIGGIVMKTLNTKGNVTISEGKAGEATSRQNKLYFTYENIGEAFQYLSDMDDTISEEFFQKMKDYASETLQNMIFKESEDWRDELENTFVKKPDDTIVRNNRCGVRKVKVWLPMFLQFSILLPKYRHKQFSSDILNALFDKKDSFLVALIYSLYVLGISYRKISQVLKLLNYNISATGVSNKLRQLQEEMDNYWKRDLGDKNYKYLMVDGLWIKEKRSIKGKHVLLSAVGITDDGEREIIGKRVSDSENSLDWKYLFDDLQDRGLNIDKINLIVSDKGKGLRSYLDKSYRDKPVVRCGFHFGMNLLKKVTEPSKKRRMFSDLFWILGPSNVSTNKLKKWKDFRRKTEVVLDKWNSSGFTNEANKLSKEIDEVLIAYRAENDINKASKLITSNMIERYFRDYRQFSYGKGTLLDESSINYLSNLVFFDINQRMKKRPKLWDLKKCANKT